MASGNPSWAPRAISKKKKNLGRGTKKTKRACEKGLRGGRRNAPSPYKKALDAVRPRVPVTLWLTNKPSKTQKRRGPTLRARRRSPGPHSGAGRVRRPDVMPFSAQRPTRGCPLRLESLLGLLEKVCGRKTERNGEKQNKTQEAAKLPCRLASEKKASEEYQENPKNARGPEWHPAKTPERKDARPKRENKPNAAGTQTRKGRKTQSACGGVPCDYLIFLSEKRKRKKKQKKAATSAKQPKEKRRQPQNTRPDIKRIFSRQFRERKTKK